jgi:hypothetical protein
MSPTIILLTTYLDPMIVGYQRILLEDSLSSIQLLNESQPNSLAPTLLNFDLLTYKISSRSKVLAFELLLSMDLTLGLAHASKKNYLF